MQWLQNSYLEIISQAVLVCDPSWVCQLGGDTLCLLFWLGSCLWLALLKISFVRGPFGQLLWFHIHKKRGSCMPQVHGFLWTINTSSTRGSRTCWTSATLPCSSFLGCVLLITGASCRLDEGLMPDVFPSSFLKRSSALDIGALAVWGLSLESSQHCVLNVASQCAGHCHCGCQGNLSQLPCTEPQKPSVPQAWEDPELTYEYGSLLGPEESQRHSCRESVCVSKICPEPLTNFLNPHEPALNLCRLSSACV